jgi:hypothetical protein
MNRFRKFIAMQVFVPFPEKLIVWIKKLPAFLEPEDSLPYSQEPAMGPSPKPDKSSPYPHILFH